MRLLRGFLAAALLALLWPPAPTSAESLSYAILPGSTLQLGAGPVDVLTGFLSINSVSSCPSSGGLCHLYGDGIEFEVTSLGITSNSFAAAASGVFPWVKNENQIGFALGRVLILDDVGLVRSGDAPKPAALFYGFGADLVLSTEAFDRYRAWTLASAPGSSWEGIFEPDSLALQLALTEQFFDLGPLGIVGTSTGQSGQLVLNAVQIPEPATGLLTGIGVAIVAARRNRRPFCGAATGGDEAGLARTCSRGLGGDREP